MTGMKNEQMVFLANSGQVIGTAALVPGAQGGTMIQKNRHENKMNSSIWKHMNKNMLK